ncbi:uroporphyrinogen-III C-methyltransferase [Polyangium aurulentum]|uniref:uroporphyrinogen-III C-methyltransferase n=1 Tax=Polyangium aurulentum TaxID=2567896 RepID=UPI0010AE5BBB|nr:uroporphyrinogen-III C-methyltransferase [Polyangium aurulentum]UQA62143.1 uroporphyrinogen-III C-methyltransferase [Polyangium aurulentum]
MKADNQDLGGSVRGATQGISGTVYLVGGGPGDPGLLTLRGAELLGTADVVLHDELIHPSLLDLARPGALVRSVGKRGSDRESKQAKQEAIEAELVLHARAGKRVVRLKGGDPFLFGRGSEEAEALVRAGIPFEVVPGVASPLAATAYAGISLTHRDFASSVILVSGTGRSGERFDWSEIASVKGTVAVLMGMHNLGEVIAGLMGPGRRDPATPAAVIQWGTRAEQRVVEGRLEEIAGNARAEGIGSPGILVVGAVASLRRSLRWFDTRPLFGKRVLLVRPKGQAGATARQIRQRGAEAIEWPAIEIAPPPDPARVERLVGEMGDHDVVAFTSENGVEKLFEAIDAAGKDARVFGRSAIAAIGTGTAAALAARGIRADIVPPKDFRGEGLADAILAHAEVAKRLSEGKAVRVAIPRALVAREALPEILRAAGCAVDVVPVYETRKASPERRAQLVRMVEDKRIDVVLLTASSTVDGLCDALGEDAARLLGGVALASIGPITTATAEKRGLSVAVTAEVSTLGGLIEAVERHFAGSSAGSRGASR